MIQWKLTDSTVKNIFSLDESVKRQITDSISENLTDSDLESRYSTVISEHSALLSKILM